MPITAHQHTHPWRMRTGKLRTKHHNSTFTLLYQQLLKSSGGRWAILGVDLGNKIVTDFTNLNPDVEATPHTHLRGITHSQQEGLQDNKSNDPDCPQSIPDYILLAHHNTKHHRPDLIRAVGYTLNTQGKLVKHLTYRCQRQIQLIKCKYSTDRN